MNRGESVRKSPLTAQSARARCRLSVPAVPVRERGWSFDPHPHQFAGCDVGTLRPHRMPTTTTNDARNRTAADDHDADADAVLELEAEQRADRGADHELVIQGAGVIPTPIPTPIARATSTPIGGARKRTSDVFLFPRRVPRVCPGVGRERRTVARAADAVEADPAGAVAALDLAATTTTTTPNMGEREREKRGGAPILGTPSPVARWSA